MLLLERMRRVILTLKIFWARDETGRTKGPKAVGMSVDIQRDETWWGIPGNVTF